MPGYWIVFILSSSKRIFLSVRQFSCIYGFKQLFAHTIDLVKIFRDSLAKGIICADAVRQICIIRRTKNASFSFDVFHSEITFMHNRI